MSFFVVINSIVHNFFKGDRGLRQGDPLSPYLFGMFMEYLSRSLARCTIRLDFHFQPKCEQYKISHLVYADGLLLLSRGDVTFVAQLVDCLLQFAEMVDLITNLAKSNIYMVGIDPPTRERILTIIGFQVGGMPFRYMEIPIAFKKLKISDYSTFLDALTRRIPSLMLAKPSSYQ